MYTAVRIRTTLQMHNNISVFPLPTYGNASELGLVAVITYYIGLSGGEIQSSSIVCHFPCSNLYIQLSSHNPINILYGFSLYTDSSVIVCLMDSLDVVSY